MINWLLANRVTRLLALSGPVLLLCGLAVLWAVGATEPAKWTETSWILGFSPNSQAEYAPPFAPMQLLDVYARGGGSHEVHLYILGSDGGGRDLLALMASGSWPSLRLVLIAVIARLLIGVLAGMMLAVGAIPVRLVGLAMGRWTAGFPYLVLAILVIDALVNTQSRLVAFAVAITLVGWRDIAELTAERTQAVLTQPYAVASKALGTGRIRLFIRHVVPHLRPVLVTEATFQASAVLVLLGELGYLGFFLGAGSSFNGVNLPAAEIGQLLSAARDYILREEWTPVLVPALTLATAALSFELLGTVLRRRWAVPS
jgi:ABC-type dipeptide/oligopeptide/nickel transport system permease subunit